MVLITYGHLKRRCLRAAKRLWGFSDQYETAEDFRADVALLASINPTQFKIVANRMGSQRNNIMDQKQLLKTTVEQSKQWLDVIHLLDSKGMSVNENNLKLVADGLVVLETASPSKRSEMKKSAVLMGIKMRW